MTFAALLLVSCGGGGGGGTDPVTPPPTNNAPAVDISNVTPGEIISGMKMVNFTASDSDGDTLTVNCIEVKRETFMTVTEDSNSPGNYTCEYDASILTEGNNGVYVYAYDGTVQGQDEVDVVIDNLMPSVAISSNPSAEPFSGSVDICVDSSETDGLPVELLKEGNVVATSTESSFCYSWDTTLENDGSYDWLARATDDAGNDVSDPASFEVINASACIDKSEDGDCDNVDVEITVAELVTYPGAIWGDQVNGGQVQVCAYADSAQDFTMEVRYNPNVVGARNTPDDITVSMNDNGPSSGDRVAGDNQYCATIDLNITEPVYYPFPTEAQGAVALMQFRVLVFDANGVGLGFQQLANNFDGVDLDPYQQIYVVNPTEAVAVADLSATERATANVLSIENPTAAGCEESRLQVMTNQAYGLFPTTPDPFDQFIMLKAGKSFRHANAQSIRIRDDVDHNSWSNIDNSGLYGSDGRLRAVACMGNDIDFSAALHEYAHPYAFFAPYQTGYHFFQSDVDQVGPLSRRGGIVSDGPDHFVQVNVNNTNERNYLPYSNMTLYSMSFIDEAGFGQVRYANRLLGAGERVHVSETTVVDGALLTTQFGPMNPSVATSNKNHRVLLVVMSDEPGVVNDAYLSATHWFAEYWTGNHVGETFNPIPYVSGIRTGSFSWTTGYLGSMETAVPPTN